MKISIVTAVYNGADTIRGALESLWSQKHVDIEHIIQDGGSTDDTLGVIARFCDARTKLESRKDSGLYEALNLGISRATGDIVGVLHCDDMFANSSVLSNVAAAFEDPIIQGVYGDLEYVAKNDLARVIRYWKSCAFQPALLREGWMPPHPTLFLRRGVFALHGLYDTSFHIASDYEAILRWFTRPDLEFSYLPELLVRMRVGGKSNRSLKNLLNKSREDLRAIRLHGIGGVDVLIAKNFRKLPQFFGRGLIENHSN